MIMDIQKSRREMNMSEAGMTSPRTADDSRNMRHPSEITPPVKNVIKRSFDVAFLMLPDEKLKQRRLQETSHVGRESSPPLVVEDVPACIPQRQLAAVNQLRSRNATPDSPTARSAFTKVSYMSSGRFEPSPAPSTSPDILSCPGSLSPPAVPPSPPVLPSYMPRAPSFHPLLAYPGSEQAFAENTAYHGAKFRPILSYRPDLAPYNPYAFPPAQQQHQHPQQQEVNNVLRHPAAAAAILTSLLPQTFSATFSLPAQNVCAKCNVSFRMTSDLVYHMRSHHKSETQADPARRRREDKLRCPVCCESFRERHHLTRHMTAHQDKEGDALDEDASQRRTASGK